MNNLTERLRNETLAGFPADHSDLLEAAADEIDGLRSLMIELLEILRQWEPDHASGEDRRTIMLAMYQTGILTDPTETIRAAEQAGKQSNYSDIGGWV